MSYGSRRNSVEKKKVVSGEGRNLGWEQRI